MCFFRALRLNCGGATEHHDWLLVYTKNKKAYLSGRLSLRESSTPLASALSNVPSDRHRLPSKF